MTGLSRFSYLRVIARSSTRAMRTSGRRALRGKELGARYVMEGNLRQAGGRLRLAVQLVDAGSGAHLWAESYERAFQPRKRCFELQDELVPRIVSTVADAHGVLPHSMSEGLRGRSPEELSPYEAVLRSFGYGYRVTPEEHARRACQPGTGGPAGARAIPTPGPCSRSSTGRSIRRDSTSGRTLSGAPSVPRSEPPTPRLPTPARTTLLRGLLLPKGVPGFSRRGGASHRAQPLERAHAGGLGQPDGLRGRLGARLRSRRASNATESSSSRLVLDGACHERLPQGRLPRRGPLGLKVNLPEFTGTHEVHGRRLRAARGARSGAGRPCASCSGSSRTTPTSPREKLEKFVSPDLVEHVMDGLRKAGLAIPDDPTKPGRRHAAPDRPPATARARRGFLGRGAAVQVRRRRRHPSRLSRRG